MCRGVLAFVHLNPFLPPRDSFESAMSALCTSTDGGEGGGGREEGTEKSDPLSVLRSALSRLRRQVEGRDGSDEGEKLPAGAGCEGSALTSALVGIFDDFVTKISQPSVFFGEDGAEFCASLLSFDKRALIHQCKGLKTAVGGAWTKLVAKRFGIVLKGMQTAQSTALVRRTKPKVGDLVEAFWDNRSWCCAEVVGVFESEESGRSYDVNYLDTSSESNVGEDRVRALDGKGTALAEAVRSGNYSLLLQYMDDYADDANTQRIGCGLVALLVYSPDWRQYVGDGHKKTLLDMGAGVTLLNAIECNNFHPSVAVPSSEMNYETGSLGIVNSAGPPQNAASGSPGRVRTSSMDSSGHQRSATPNEGAKVIDKALRALYNFTFHLDRDIQESLIQDLLEHRADEVIANALRTYSDVIDVRRWGTRTLYRLVGPERMEELGISSESEIG